jgi:hypothetical protein
MSGAREALAALQIFCDAAKRETATVEMTRQVVKFPIGRSMIRSCGLRGCQLDAPMDAPSASRDPLNASLGTRNDALRGHKVRLRGHKVRLRGRKVRLRGHNGAM